MNEDRRARLWSLFEQAADLPPEDQHALLDAACRDDAALRAEVERLLAGDARLHAGGGASAFLDSPVARSPTPAIPGPRLPSLRRCCRGSAATASCACSARGGWAPSTRPSRTTRAASSP